MTTIKERASRLGRPVSFDSGAFRGDAEAPQELCNVMLAFALAFNDCRDLLFWHSDAMEETPKEVKLNRFFGEHGGVSSHGFRLLLAFIHELGELVRKNGKVFQHPFFVDRVLPKLDKPRREMWDRVRSLAAGKAGDKSMDELLEFLRNKATYHYDAGDLFPAFDGRFPAGAPERIQQPVVSFGAQVRNVRFYFADAVGLELVEAGAQERGLMPLGPKLEEVLDHIAITLARIVEAFIQTRRPWREFEEEN